MPDAAANSAHPQRSAIPVGIRWFIEKILYVEGRKRKDHPSGVVLQIIPYLERLAARRLRSDLADVLSRRALLALHDVELDTVALGEALESGSLNRRVVHEEVLAAILRRDEAEALGVIEPLHFSCVAHCRCLSFFLFWAKKTKRDPL